MSLPLLLVFGMLVGLLSAGVWVGITLTSIGLVSLEIFRNIRVDRFHAGDLW